MKKTKRAITLIEILIVMFLITVIGGVVAFNVRGSMEQGKAFRTYEGIEKIKNVLTLAVAQNPSAIDNLEQDWQVYLVDSPLVRNAKEMSRDGWGVPYDVRVLQDHRGVHISVESTRFDAYKAKHPGAFPEDDEIDDSGYSYRRG